MGFEGGGHVKKYGFKGGGGASRKNMVCEGGVTSNANVSARRPTIAILRLGKFKFSWGRMPQSPYFIIHPTATLPHQLFHYKIQPGECQLFFGLCWSDSKTTDNSVQNSALNRP